MHGRPHIGYGSLDLVRSPVMGLDVVLWGGCEHVSYCLRSPIVVPYIVPPHINPLERVLDYSTCRIAKDLESFRRMGSLFP